MKRICFNCGSDKTYLYKGKYPDWRKHNENHYCLKCHSKLFNNYEHRKDYYKNIANPRIHAKWNHILNPINNPRRIWFKTKSVFLDQNPRTGICSNCHNDDPLKDTIELCNSCHKIQHQVIWK